jgi:isochorismate hydrolase
MCPFAPNPLITYIPTISVLQGLAREGFEPFMVAQTRVRDDSRREHTKHLIRLRHRSQVVALDTNEIILINSHDACAS